MPADYDFIGFSYGGVSNTALNVIRTSPGDTYDELLSPSTTESTSVTPGVNGTMYFYTTMTSRSFTVEMAFEDLTESQLRLLFRTFNPNAGIKPFIFTERPYKVYMAKVQAAPTIKYVCFDNAGSRIYKGTLSVQFICYDPMAQTPSEKKYLNQYTDTNKSQQAAASGLLSTQDVYDTPTISGGNTYFKVYNAGDVEAPFQITMTAAKFKTCTQIHLYDGTTSLFSISLTGNSAAPNDITYTFDTHKHLILGSDGQIYNKYISAGDQFNIPLTSTSDDIKLFLMGFATSSTADCNLVYNYLYY